MWTRRYFNPRYWASRFWAKVGSTAPPDICGDVTGADVAYSNVVGIIANHQVTGTTTAYVTATGEDEECQ